MGLSAVAPSSGVLPTGTFEERGLWYATKHWVYGSATGPRIWHSPSQLVLVGSAASRPEVIGYAFNDTGVAKTLPGGAAWYEIDLGALSNLSNGKVDLRYADIAFSGSQFFVGRQLWELAFDGPPSGLAPNAVLNFEKPTFIPSAQTHLAVRPRPTRTWYQRATEWLTR